MSPAATDLKRPGFDDVRPPRKRKRIVISCTECHRRKQKCDRASPCSNCVTRGKQSACHYENESARKQQLEEDAAATSSTDARNTSPLESNSATQVAALGYAKENGNNTLGIFKRIEDYGGQSFLSGMASSGANVNGLRERYKSLIRQLPSKPHIEKLLETFFQDVNPKYFSIDESMFRDLWADWSNLSFSVLNKGPSELRPDLRFFPALLFQILALALQFQPVDYDPSLDAIKYAAAMTFDDLASDYSESGQTILCLLGKRSITLVTVQAGFLRASYLKNCGMVPESWHSLSQTIRDAQEIRLHEDLVDHRPRDAPQTLENLWMIQLRRRMWLLLSMWDVTMALVLGRPTTIDLRDAWATFPVDAPMPKDRRAVAPLPRSPTDPPTSLTALLWKAEIAAPLRDILILEKEGAHPKDFSKVEKMHHQILQIYEHCPAFFRTENPDTTFDTYPGCHWLRCTRPLFDNAAAFTLMALHRPYIFTNAGSRTEALKAALDILRAQRTHFQYLQPKHYKMFELVLNTFDAIVLVAAIYILHPTDNREFLDDTLQHFDWAMERFEIISERNVMAKAALGVVKAIHLRMKKAVDLTKLTNSNFKAPPLPTSPTKMVNDLNISTSGVYLPQEDHNQQQGTQSSVRSSFSTTTSAPTVSSASHHNTHTPPSNSSDSISPANEWTTNILPSNVDFSSLAPLQPMHDLFFNDLTSVPFESQLMNVDAGTAGMDMYDPSLGGGQNLADNGLAATNWQFEGDFGSDSFWGFMNTYNR